MTDSTQNCSYQGKEFKTIDEQIDILKDRGLKIPDIEKAREFLFHNNYYRISGYSLTLRKDDTFFKSVTFQNIIDIYEFDSELRHILLKYLEIIEVTVKSIYAHEFTRVYGPTGYLDFNNYTNKEKYDNIIDKTEKQKFKSLPYESYLKHYIEDLKQDMPLWVYVDLLTISDISFLFSITSKDLKLVIADKLGLTKQGDKLLEKFLHSMTIIRNLCAHGSRLYNRLFHQKPYLSSNEKKLLRLQKDGNADNAHLYSFIFIMKRLLKPSEFNEMKAEIINLTLKYPFVKMRYYGFRDDWQEVL